jgi:glycosyltransferase involved in cell wall biosynthesis
MRVAIHTNIPSPYRIQLFHYAHLHMRDMRVTFQAEMGSDRPWESRPELMFDHAYLSTTEVRVGGRRVSWNHGLLKDLELFQPNVIVAAGFSLNVLACAIYSLRRRIALVSFSDSTPYTDPTSGAEAGYRRLLLRVAKGAIAASTLSRDYYVRLGMARDMVRIVELTTDLHRIRRESRDPGRRERVRRRWGLHGPTACFAGRLINSKCVLDACDAFSLVKASVPTAQLLIVGDGPEKARIQRWIESHRQGGVVLLDAVTPGEMVDVYSASDVLVFPAVRERFGMVVIEALAAGLPVIAASTSGAGADLLRDGENGIVVGERDVPAIANAMARLLGDPALRTRMSCKAMSVAEEHDVTIEAKRFVDAIQYFGTEGEQEQNKPSRSGES